MKVIALDYDDTYTEDPELFGGFVEMARAHGHLVVVVTGRDEAKHGGEIEADLPGIEVIYTAGKPKRQFCSDYGLSPNIWIDDWPEIICGCAQKGIK